MTEIEKINEALKPLGLRADHRFGELLIQKFENNNRNLGRSVASLLATQLSSTTFARELAETDWQPDDLQLVAVNVRHCRIPTLQLKRDAASAALTLKAAILKAREFFPQ